MVKRVLMIAFHFPPQRGSSGIQRTLKFCRYLPASGWHPVVLSAHPRAYVETASDQLGDIPETVEVHRAFALDTARHLSFKRRYASIMALPDRWVSWCFGALPAGLRLIRTYRPAVLWSTYPIASAHLIALALHRLTGIAWVADMRDPMTGPDYPADPLTRRVYHWIEAKTVQHCTRVVCTTPGAIRAYQSRFPAIPLERFCLIENGYDEENFADAAAQEAPVRSAAQPFVLVHSGIIYPSERDPAPFFKALASLLEQKRISGATLQVILRAPVHDDYLNDLIRQQGIETIVSLAPHIPYREALAEMLGADGLLILQAANCNQQIPAKLYEYLRAGRPILALTDTAGDTAATLRKAGIDTIAALDNRADILAALMQFIPLAESGKAPLASFETSRANSRNARSIELASLLDRVVAEARAEAD
jgi:glycosyltransferase involved in cell wall biosynthesis